MTKTLCFYLAVIPILLYAQCEKKVEKPSPLSAKKIEQIDSKSSQGTIDAIALNLETHLDLPEINLPLFDDPALKKALNESKLSQTMLLSKERGKSTFTAKDFFLPVGTELRYNPESKKYILLDPIKKTYWDMSGSEIGNLLEGGPPVKRQNYSISIIDENKEQKIAGYPVKKSTAELACDWSIATRTGKRQGSIEISISFWHSKDPRLKEPWRHMMVDFLTMPFQDKEGIKILETLKKKIGFPLKWSMRVSPKSGRTKNVPPRLTTLVTKVEMKKVNKTEFSFPPTGYKVAITPYEFGEGGQKIDEAILAKLPVNNTEKKKGN